MKLKYYAGLCMLALMGGALTSCDDETYDVVGNPDNLVYVNIAQDFPEGMPKNTYCYGLYQTPVGAILNTEPAQVLLYAQCTKTAPQDIEVTFKVDPTAKVEGYDPFPEDGRIEVGFPDASGIGVSLKEATVVIPKGETRSNTIVANVNTDNANWSAFNGSNYVLPIVISKVNGAVASNVMCQAYVGVQVDHKDGMVNPEATSVPGTQLTDYTGMTATYSAPASNIMDRDISNVFTSNNYVFYVPNHADKVNEEVIINIDLGKTRKISGLNLRYFYAWYTVQDCQILTSIDGVDYIDQGSVSWSNNGVNRNVAFWAAYEMRYIQIVTHSFYGGTGEGTALNYIHLFE